jgi:hypothetical protein
MRRRAGFAVIYRWRLHPGREALFQEIWARNTVEIARRCGGLGSRLHRADDGSWLAYAQWPDRATWERSYDVPDWDPEGSHLIETCVAERLPRLLLDPVADLLWPAEASPPPAAESGR